MRILVYNEKTNKMERYERKLGDAMPYIKYRYLTVKEFKSNSKTTILWTSKATMEAFNVTRARWDKNIYVGFAFKRIFEGGHTNQSQHYAGVAFDVAQNLSVKERTSFHALCVKLKVWTYVEPLRLTPRWLHFDKRNKKPACAAGFPKLVLNSVNEYVCVLQDCLSTLGYYKGNIDGLFGNNTKQAVITFQNKYDIAENETVDCKTWQKLTSLTNNIGKTSTTKYYS